jgi:hypothetical protein
MTKRRLLAKPPFFFLIRVGDFAAAVRAKELKPSSRHVPSP